jgi:hypothetical protein
LAMMEERLGVRLDRLGERGERNPCGGVHATRRICRATHCLEGIDTAA